MSVDPLEVRLHGNLVGTLLLHRNNCSLFTFNKEYIEQPARSTLSTGFKDEHGQLLTSFDLYQDRLMPFFSNLLPEGPLRDRLAKHAGINPEHEFLLLSHLGADLPGAVSTSLPSGISRHSLDELAAIDRALKSSSMRFSLSGLQLKFPVVKEHRKYAVPASGVGGSWIVKLPSQAYPGLPENEYSMMRLAELVGINTPPCELIDPAEIGNLPVQTRILGAKAFAIRRFDRLPDGSPIHKEDFSQIFGIFPERKYAGSSLSRIARVIGRETSHEDAVEFVNRIIFTALIGNGDMHLKDWSLVYPNRINAALSPAYDLISTLSYTDKKSSGLKFSRTRKFSKLNVEELSHLAHGADLPRKPLINTARETIARFRQVWESEKRHLPMFPNVLKAIDQHWPTIPLVQELGA